jgi:hypothetical protein
MNTFIIDTHTNDGHKNLFRRLKALKTTIRIDDDGHYLNCSGCSRIYIETIWNESQLDNWLYKTKGINYIGMCSTERRPE